MSHRPVFEVANENNILLFEAALELRGMSPRTIQSYSSAMRNFIKSRGVVEHDKLAIEASLWMNSIRRKYDPSSLATFRGGIRSYASWAEIPNVLENYRMPTKVKEEPTPYPGGQETVDCMIAAARTPQDRAFMVLIAKCGLRISEACAVMPDDITSVILDGNPMWELTVHYGKGAKTRKVPVSNASYELLKPALRGARMRATEGGMNPTIVGYEVRFGQIRHKRLAIEVLGKREGSKVKPHDGRATFATHLADNGVPIEQISTLLGHANITVTQRYVRASRAQMRKAVADLL